MELNSFWLIVIVLVLAGHFIWFIIYAIRLLKDNSDEKP